MYYNLLNILLLIGSIQGFLFVAIIFFSKRFKSKSIFYLTMLVLGFALNNFQYYFIMADLISPEMFFGRVYLPFASLNIVFYYFYVKYFLYPDFKIKKEEKFLFAPFLFFLTLILGFKLVYITGNMTDNTETVFMNLLFFHEVFSLTYSVALLLMTFHTISDYHKKMISGEIELVNRHFNWLVILSVIGFVLCLIWLAALAIELWGTAENNTFFYTLWIGISFTVYILGYVGVYRYGILEEQFEIKLKRNSLAHSIERLREFKTGNDNLDKFRNYIVVEKNYLNGNLSLGAVADHLRLNRTYLSRIINTELNVSFSDYVNQLRVEEAKKYLEDPNFSNYTLHSIGLEVGFNSKSSFNSSFKKFTGMTPHEYKKKNFGKKVNP